MELAKLAALLRLGPGETMWGLNEAMKFYFEAVLFCGELPENFEDLLTAFGSQRRNDDYDRRMLEPTFQQMAADNLELDPHAPPHADKVLCYLAERGLAIKTVDGLVKNLSRFHERSLSDLPIKLRIPVGLRRPTATGFIAQFKVREAGRFIYRFPKVLLSRAADYARWRKKESRREGAKTKKIRQEETVC